MLKPPCAVPERQGALQSSLCYPTEAHAAQISLIEGFSGKPFQMPGRCSAELRCLCSPSQILQMVLLLQDGTSERATKMGG